MPTINQTRLAAYQAAEAKILQGQSVRFEDRELRRADLEYVGKQIDRLQAIVAREGVGSRAGFKQANFGDCS